MMKLVSSVWEEPPNMPLQLTATIAAHSVFRPLCLLRMAAAEWRVVQSIVIRSDMRS